MRGFLLVAKSWLFSIKKFKFIFVVFLLLNFLFAGVFTIFLETRGQIAEQTKLQEGEINDNAVSFKGNFDFFNEEKNLANDWRFYQLFCTDYLEINQNKRRWIKRIPILTFGGKEGCFEKLDFDLEWDYILEKQISGSYKAFFTDLKFKNQDYTQILKLNEESPFYKKSLHFQLLQKYKQTNDEEYLNLAKKIEETFFPKIVKNLEKELLRRVRELNSIYLFEKDEQISFTDLVNELQLKLNFINSDVETKLQQKFSKNWSMLLSKKQKEWIRNFLKERDKQSQENQKQTKTIIQNWLENTKEGKENVEDANYQNFETDLDTKISNKLLAETIALREYLETESNHSKWWKWIEANKENSEWLWRHFATIQSVITQKQPLIKFLNEISNFLIRLKGEVEPNSQLNDDQKNELKKVIEEGKAKKTTVLQTNQTAKITEALKWVEKNKQNLSHYLSVQTFWKNQEKWKEIKNSIFNSTFFNSQVETWDPDRITKIYTSIETEIKKLNLLKAQMLNQFYFFNKNHNWKMFGLFSTYAIEIELAKLILQIEKGDLAEQELTVGKILKKLKGYASWDMAEQKLLEKIQKSALSIESSQKKIAKYQTIIEDFTKLFKHISKKTKDRYVCDYGNKQCNDYQIRWVPNFFYPNFFDLNQKKISESFDLINRFSSLETLLNFKLEEKNNFRITQNYLKGLLFFLFFTEFPSEIKKQGKYFHFKIEELLVKFYKKKQEKLQTKEERGNLGANNKNEKDHKSLIEKILHLNYLQIKQAGFSQIYNVLIELLETGKKYLSLRVSQIILDLIEWWKSKEEDKNLITDFLKETENLKQTGFNFAAKIDFPTKKINSDFIKLILPNEKTKFNPEEGDKVIFENTIPYQYDQQNWFNNLFWDWQKNWMTNNFLGPIKRKDFDLFFAITLKLNDLEATMFKKTLLRDQQNDKNYLIIEVNDKLFNLHIMEGRRPIFDNEIVISPLLARNWNLKVGDKFKILQLSNLKVVGIGIQKHFIYPIISFSAAPQKNEGVLYVTKNTNQNYLSNTIKRPSKSRFFNETKKTVLIFKNKNPDRQQRNLHNWKQMVGYNNNFTKNSLQTHGQMDEINEDVSLSGRNFVHPLVTEFNFDQNKSQYQLTQKMISLNEQILVYLALSTMIICLLIVASVTFYMAWSNVDGNRREIGILKSLGMRTSFFLMGSTSLLVFLVLAVFFGWIAGVISQVFIFDTIEGLFNFQFEKYKFNFIHLIINLAIVLGTVFLSFFTLFIFKLSKMNVRDFLYKKQENVEKKLSFFNLLINKTNLSKFHLVKINHIFFSQIWKKVVILIFAFLFLTLTITANILFLTISEQTKEKNYAAINHNYEIVYSQPIANNPLSRKKTFVSTGYEQALEENENIFSPLKKDTLKLFIKKENENDPEVLKGDKISSILWFILPVHWKTTNLNLLKAEAEAIGAGGERDICRLIIGFVQTFNKLENKDKCLTNPTINFLPFKTKDFNKAASQIPLSVGQVQFNPQKDELFTLTEGKIAQNNWIRLYGLNENTEAFNFSAKTKEKVFEKGRNEDSSTTIPVVVNNSFLKNYNFKVGDKFKMEIIKKRMRFEAFQYEPHIWFYEDKYNHLSNDPDKRIYMFDELDDGVRFFDGKELAKNTNFKFKNNKIIYKGKEVQLVYQNKKGEWKPILDINNVKIKKATVDNWDEAISPFSPTPYEKKEIVRKKISWFARQILDNKIELMDVFTQPVELEIVDSFKEIAQPKVFMNQGNLNQLMGFSTKKDKFGQYKWFNGRFSKSEKIYNAFYNIPLITKYGYGGVDAIDVSTDKNILDIKQVSSPFLEKKGISQITNYLIRMIMVFLVIEILIIFFFFIFLLMNIIKSIQEIGLKLKLFGFSKGVVVGQLAQIIFIPFLIGFSLGIFAVNVLFKLFLNYLSQMTGTIFFYFDQSPLWPGIVFALLLIVLLLLLWQSYQATKKTDFKKLINEN